MAAAVLLKVQLLCKEQEQVQTVSEVIVLDIFTQAMFSSNHRVSFAVLLLLSNGSHIYDIYRSHQPLEAHQENLPEVCTEVKAEGCTLCPIGQESNTTACESCA